MVRSQRGSQVQGQVGGLEKEEGHREEVGVSRGREEGGERKGERE